MSELLYPGAEWERAAPGEAGLDVGKLDAAGEWLRESAGDAPYRAVVVRGGRVIAEWYRDCAADEQLGLASATKSAFSCMLGIAIREGWIRSADARIEEYYPEAMDVPEGTGPKDGRFVRPKDRAATFRQVISNTSGYMKPGEEPGQVFNYQTEGMNIVCHSISKTQGLYDIADPEGSPGLRALMDRYLREPLEATWGYYLGNFDLPAAARQNIFGYYQGIKASALDMARLGLLWLRWGAWRGEQLVPEGWLRAATRVAPNILEHCPREQWTYGYAFWTNEQGMLWPNLPRDSYAAAGARRKHIWVCPSLDLVVTQSPGIYRSQEELDGGLLSRIVDAVL